MSNKSLTKTEIFLLELEKSNIKFVHQNQLNKNEYYTARNNLLKCEFISVEKNNKINFTNKGLIKLQRIKWRELNKKNKSGKKCVVIFDIPETKRRTRDLFRKCLYELGFKKVQKSVFMGPKEFEKHINELAENCYIKNFVMIIKGN